MARDLVEHLGGAVGAAGGVVGGEGGGDERVKEQLAAIVACRACRGGLRSTAADECVAGGGEGQAQLEALLARLGEQLAREVLNLSEPLVPAILGRGDPY